MPRRTPYTRVEKENQNRPDHVAGMGDVVFKGFQCLNPPCEEFITVREDDIGPDFEIPCPSCQFIHAAGGESKMYDYNLVHTQEQRIIESGEFVILHDDYINEAQRLKYCIVCYTRKPLEFFGNHRTRQSGRQGECSICKTTYNGIKNQSRITDQHREAANRRRLYKRLSGDEGKIDSQAIFEKFEGKCFKCEQELTYTAKGQKDFNLDHTLPAALLWPLTTDNATLLCSRCNGEKTDVWPSVFYSDAKLKRLAVLTGYTYALLAGEACINENAVSEILADTDVFIETWIHYPEDIIKVRNLIHAHTGEDIYNHATHVPDHLRPS